MASPAQTLYRVTTMGTLGGPYTTPFAINNSGQVACQSYNSPTTAHACIWDGTVHDLGTLGGPLSGADSINNKGQLVGTAQTTGGLSSHAFLYGGSVMTDLGTLGGTISNADSINDNGQIVGQSFVTALTFHAFLYDGTMHDLGTLGGTNSEAKGINNKGQIVGISDTAANINGGAFLYFNGVMTNLGGLGGQLSGAAAINNNGQIVGSSQLAGGDTHAFLYDGSMHDLGTLGGNCAADAINDSGQIVGYFSPTPTVPRAFIYSNGTMTDLNTLLMPGSLPGGSSLAVATGINNAGVITAKGSDGVGYILSPNSTGGGSTTLPSISSVVNGADFKSEAISPGAWVSIFGQNLGSNAAWTTSDTTTLGGASVSICGLPALMSYNSGPVTSNGSTSWQINALLPGNLSGQTSCPAVVTVNNQESAAINVSVASGVLELFNFTSSAGQLPITTHSDYSLVGPATAGLVPAKPNETVIAWATGDCATPTIAVNATAANVLFSGSVAPGLCQINFVIPSTVSAGNDTMRISSSPNSYNLWVAQ
jgi:probable HAF family extracellular repeat protein